MASWTYSLPLVVAACGGSWKHPPPPAPAPLTPAPPGFRLEKLVARTDGAVAYVDGWIVEKGGRIVNAASGEVLLDISAEVTRDTEQGLLGLAFHPRDPGRYFINYTDRSGDTRVVEMPSKKVLLAVDQIRENHNGGHLLFGPDGKLWIGLGDGGDWHDRAGNTQNDASHLGKMIVLDVDTGEATHVAKGLRNPWRYDFDAAGNLYIGDVGQEKWEEIDFLPAGARGVNYGWPRTEGMHCYRYEGCDRDTPPIFEYGHDTGCSITGGVVYEGSIAELRGHYFYADYCSAILRSIKFDGEKVVESWDWKPMLDPDSRLANISSFAEDESGELYIVTMWDGIYKLVRAQ